MTNQSSPESVSSLADWLAQYAICFIDDERVGRRMLEIVAALRAHAQTTREGMARLSASEVACYRWPEDTAEHRAMRAAFCDGATYTAVTSTSSCTPLSAPGDAE